jgi:hypothetical protein
MDNIYDCLDEDAPCKDCANYGDGHVYDNGEMYHEFICYGGYCIYCAENNGFSCFKKMDGDDE